MQAPRARQAAALRPSSSSPRRVIQPAKMPALRVGVGYSRLTPYAEAVRQATKQALNVLAARSADGGNGAAAASSPFPLDDATDNAKSPPPVSFATLLTCSQPERTLEHAASIVNECASPAHGTLGATVHGIFPSSVAAGDDFSAAPGVSVALAHAPGYTVLGFSAASSALPASVATHVAKTAATDTLLGRGGGAFYVCNATHANDPDKTEALLSRLHGALPHSYVVGGAAGGMSDEVCWLPATERATSNVRDDVDHTSTSQRQSLPQACGIVLLPPHDARATSSSAPQFDSRCLPGYRPIGRRMRVTDVSVEPADIDGYESDAKVLLLESLDHKPAAAAVHESLMECVASSRTGGSKDQTFGGVVLGIADDKDDMLVPCEFFPSTRRRALIGSSFIGRQLPTPPTADGSRGAAGDAAGAPKHRRGGRRNPSAAPSFAAPPGSGDGALEVTGASGARVGGFAQLMTRDEVAATNAADVCVSELGDDGAAAFLFGCWGAPHALETARLLRKRLPPDAVQAGLFSGEVANAREHHETAPGRGRMHAYSCALALLRM